jgi:nitrite reductase/ring-hydroxylating ferredoxin subunit
MSLQEVAMLDEIEAGEMKHIEAGGREILLANVGGKIYAMDDRCGHMSAPLSMGRLDGKIAQCPLHFARFDVTTGKCVRKAHMSGIEGKILAVTKLGKVVDAIRTLDRETFKVVVEDGKIKLEV